MISVEVLATLTKFRQSVKTADFDSDEIADLGTQEEAFHQEFLEDLTANPDKIYRVARRVREIYQNNGRLSRPFLSANVTLEFFSDSLSALHDNLVNSPLLYAADPRQRAIGAPSYDFLLGGMVVVGAVLVAERKIGDISDQLALDTLDTLRKSRPAAVSITDEVATYLKLHSFGTTNAELLKKGSTGLELVEQVAKRYNDPLEASAIPVYMVREFVGMGANFGVDFYKILYPLSPDF